jgi:photosystem II stability/assembly factor-like uncharacterized protein
MLAVSLLLSRSARAGESTIYAASLNSVFKSTDSAMSWNFGSDLRFIFCLATDPTNSEILYAGTANGVFKSSDGGQHWLGASSGMTDFVILSLAIDPSNPNIIYAGTSGGGFFPGHQLFKSSDGALTWTLSNSGLPSSIINVVRIDPSNSAVLYAGTNFAGVYKSINGGETWAAANAGMTPAPIQDLAIDPDSPSTLYAGVASCSTGCLGIPAGVFKSTNGGLSWTEMNSGLTDLRIVSLAIVLANTGTVYAGTQSQGIFRTMNAGVSWDPTTPTLLATLFGIPFLPLAADPINPGTVFAGNANGVFKITEGTTGWTSVSSGLPAAPGIFAMAIAPAVCTPPVMSDASASPSTLWPPNHKMVEVTVSYTTSGSCPSACTLSVTSNEPGGVRDAVVVDANHVLLRAERDGKGSGRVYTITITCTNSDGQSSSQSVIVTVAHDQG